MSEEKVTRLPGTVYVPSPDRDLTPATLLANASGKADSMLDVVIVARLKTGEIVGWSTAHDIDRVLGLLSRGMLFLAEAQQVSGDG